MKIPKFRNISISQISTTPDRTYKQVVIAYIIITYLYSLNQQQYDYFINSFKLIGIGAFFTRVRWI
jgi:hypothetical protein